MEKLEEIKKVLNFYVKANELKNKIVDEVNNYSVADHLFGCMILATAIDSEFKETDNLAKLYRMLFLSEYSNLYHEYDFKDLKLNKQYSDEVLEARDMSTKDGKLVFKYKVLDHLLTKLIKDKENDKSNYDLIKEGSLLISGFCDKKPYECEEIFKFYYLNFKLKNKTRSGWDNTHWNVKSNRIETVSEHVIGTLALAIAFNSELDYNLDINKVLRMLTIHETGETLIGDITPFDGITPEEKEKLEHRAMRDALWGLKAKDELLNLLYEFDEHKTLEAKFSFFCDKIEADLQAKVYQEKGMQHSLDDQENNVVFNSSKVKQMLKDGAKTAFDIWYEWDKNIYNKDKDFPEFMNILKIAKANNLHNIDKVVKEQVILTDEEHSLLSKEISNIVKELHKDDNIDSIYITSYQDFNEKGTLYIEVILKSTKDYRSYERLMNQLHSKLSTLHKTGINVKFNYDFLNNYSTTALNSSEVRRVERLTESTILFDKSGYLSEVQDEMKKYDHLYNFNLVDYIPPIDKSISHRLVKGKK